MFTHTSVHLVRALAPPKLAAGVLFTLALLSAACSDSASRLSAPQLQSNSSNRESLAASNFTVLANQAVTCTAATITGNVGTFQAAPTGSVTQTEGCSITGTVHVGDEAAVQAYESFLNAYSDLADVPCDVFLTGTLAGVTLAPGVYCFTAAAAPTGLLTLRGPANGEWLFKIGTGGTGAIEGTNFSVVMAGGGQACNVTWWVAQAATMTDSDFIGSILAGAGITMTRGTSRGNLSSKADVTITGTALTGCDGSGGNGHGDGHGNGNGHGNGHGKAKCNQGVGNGPEGCDPGNSNHRNPSNDENGGVSGKPGRKP